MPQVGEMMTFISNGFKELLRYGNLSVRTTKLQLLGAFVLLIPVVFVIAIASSILGSASTATGIIGSAIIQISTLIFGLPFFVAVIVRRINDRFPGSSWTRFFSRKPDVSLGQIAKFVAVWIGLVALGLAIAWIFWPLYLVAVLTVLVLPQHQPVATAFTPVPPPPTLKGSGSLPPLPSFQSPMSSEIVSPQSVETPAYKQGIFWVAIAASLFIGVWLANPGIFSGGNPAAEIPVPLSTSNENNEQPGAETPAITSTPTPTSTPTLVPTGVATITPVLEGNGDSGLDPHFRTCGDANAAGYGDYISGVDPEYDWYMDRDRDGIVCER